MPTTNASPPQIVSEKTTQGGATTSSATELRQPSWSKPNAIPNHRVNDGSKIEIVTVEDEQRDSMVRNSFEKSSIEAGVSGGYAGVGVGVTVGSSSDSQKGELKEKKSTTTKMIGKYMVRSLSAAIVSKFQISGENIIADLK
jgi:hypothetical protein